MKKIECPMNEFTCPYYNGFDNCCDMEEMEGVTPLRECEAFDGVDEITLTILENS